MISHILRQFVIFSVAAGMLLDPLAAAAQYAYPTYSPTPTPTPTPAATFPALDPAAVAEAEGFEPVADFEQIYVNFVEGKGDKSIEFVPKVDVTDPSEKKKYDTYKDMLLKAISQAMQDTDLIKQYEKENIHFIVVTDLKAYLIANAKKYGLSDEFVKQLKEKGFVLESFLLMSKAPDGTITYILLIDASVFKSFAGVIAAVVRELHTMILSGKVFPTPLDQEIAVLEATIASLEKILAGMQKMVGDDHKAVKDLKALLEAQKAKLAELKKKKAAAEPKPSPICVSPAPMMSPSPSPVPC